MVNLSKSHPTLSNHRGLAVVEGAAWTLGAVVIVVALRLWGRFRYASSSPSQTIRARFGDQRFWVLLSDVAILVATLVAIALTCFACVGAYWGLGLHTALLSPTQTQKTLEMFYLYQIFYKLGAGISKIATCLLFLAISSQQMVKFNRVCQIMIVYIIGYSLSCSIATVFQCGIDFESNWNHTKSQAHCFPKPPFWYIHAGFNIGASVVIAFLPWWLFYYISYKRKYIIATLMTMLAVSEIIFGCVRLEGLYISAHSLSDLTFGATTGILVSQLEVNFGIIAACIPTVMKLLEEFFRRLFRLVTGKELSSSADQSQSLKSGVHLSTLDKSQHPHKNYSRFGEDEEDLGSTHSGNSRVNIIPRGPKDQIRVDTSFLVESKPEEDEKTHMPISKARSTTNVVISKAN